MDLSSEEFRMIKSLNQKVKGIGGEVKIVWNVGQKIEKWSITAEESGETIYNSNPTKSSNEVELKD